MYGKTKIIDKVQPRYEILDMKYVIAGRSGRLSVSESGRLSESRVDCQKVGQTVRKSGRLSESRADCQKVGQTVRKSGRLSESRGECQQVGKPFFSVVTTTFLVDTSFTPQGRCSYL